MKDLIIGASIFTVLGIALDRAWLHFCGWVRSRRRPRRRRLVIYKI
jgi:hypothetical protein